MKKELSKLLSLNIEASKGYAYAAKKIENKNFKNFLKTYSRQRKRHAHQIRTVMVLEGIDVFYSSSFLGDIHHGYLKLRGMLGRQSDDDLVAECIRGENESLVQYEKAIKTNIFPSKMQKMALEHLNKIRAAESTLHEIHHVL